MATRRRKTTTKKPSTKKETIRGELGDTLGAINKRYGETTCRSGSSIVQPGRISTGTFMLDFALLGGIPDNRISMVVGPLRPETLSTHALALTRIRGPVARADAAVVLVVASALVLSLGGIGVWLAERRGRRLAPGRS